MTGVSSLREQALPRLKYQVISADDR